MKYTATALSALFLLGACGPNAAEAPPSADAVAAATEAAQAEIITEETARINAFFDAKYQESVARSPMQQTYLGIKTDYDKWDDASEAAEIEEMELFRAEIAEMQAEFDINNLDPQAALSYRLKEYQLEQAERSFAHRGNNLVFSQMRGQHSGIPAFLINQHRVADVSDAEAYISRLDGVTEYLGAHQTRANTAAENGVLAPRFVYDYVIEAAGNVITGYPFEGAGPDTPSPLYEDFANKVAELDIAEDEKDDLLFRARGSH